MNRRPSRGRGVGRCLVLISAVGMAASLAVAAPRRNVVLFIADDHGPDAGCYGNRLVKTPHLDRLAAEGTLFRLAFCTTASCSPSRSVLLTGLHNHANGQYGLQHSYHGFETHRSVKTLPVLLREAGYRTARAGKFHVGSEETYRFDVHLRGNPGGGRNPVSMAELCRGFFAEASERPFFLLFATDDPHRSGGEGRAGPTAPDRFGNGKEHAGVREERYDPAAVAVPPFLPDIPECRAELAEYYQSVSRVDQGLGRLVEVLKETGRWEDTLFIYLSDNGIAFPGAKTGLYEPGMRLPLIVRSPDAAARGVVSSAMVSWVDVTPSILDFAGALDDRSRFHGRSFLPVLAEERPAGWDEVYASHTFHEVTMYYPMRAVRGRKYKYVWNLAAGLPFPFASDLHASATWQAVLRGKLDRYGKRAVATFLQRPAHELYDLEADPDETVNLAGDPARRDVLDELQAKLKAWQQATGDPWRIKHEHE